MDTNEWPKFDPVTNRMVCESCWNGTHYHKMFSRRNHQGNMENYWVTCDKLAGKAEHACDGECDCVHRSEETWAAIERQTAKNNRKELRRNLKEQLEDPDNPLVAHNDSFKPKKKGKAHA